MQGKTPLYPVSQEDGGGTSVGFLEDLDPWTLAGTGTRSLRTLGQSLTRPPAPFPLLPPGGLNPRQVTHSHRYLSRVGAPGHHKVQSFGENKVTVLAKTGQKGKCLNQEAIED